MTSLCDLFFTINHPQRKYNYKRKSNIFNKILSNSMLCSENWTKHGCYWISNFWWALKELIYRTGFLKLAMWTL